MYVRHEISDYATWRKSYDAFNAERTKMSVTGAAVYRAVDNPNDVTVTHDFKSADKAKEFASSAPFEGSHGEGWRQGRSTNLVHHSCREITFGLEPRGKRLGAMQLSRTRWLRYRGYLISGRWQWHGGRCKVGAGIFGWGGATVVSVLP